MSSATATATKRRPPSAGKPATRIAKRQGALEFQLLLFVALGLVAFGLVMVFSATSAPAALGGSDPWQSVKRQGIYALLGLGALFVAARTDFRKLRLLAPALLGISFVLCLLVLTTAPINGAKRWLAFGALSFQPSELVKLSVGIWLAGYLARTETPRTLGELLRPIGMVVGLFALLIVVQPDLGTTIGLMVMTFGILFVSGVPLPTLGGAMGLVSGAAFIGIMAQPYQRVRLFSFFHPFEDAGNTGYQLAQAVIGLGSGGVFGRGLGQGVQKIIYLPEANTDMILAVVGEELGLVGVTLVVLAYATFAYAGFRVALACRDPFGKRLAAGLTTLICGQATVNLAAVLGIAPLTGIPLPFISYGGTNLLLTLASVGVLLNIAVHGGKQPAPVPDRGRGNSGTRRPRARRR